MSQYIMKIALFNSVRYQNAASMTEKTAFWRRNAVTVPSPSWKSLGAKKAGNNVWL